MILRLAWLCLILLGLAIVPRPARAENACTPARVPPVTIEAVQAHFDSFDGHCVRLRGLAVQGRLYSDRQAMLDPVPLVDEARPRSIEIAPADVEGAPDKPAWVEIAGKLGSCAWAHTMAMNWMAEHPGELMTVGGYCHGSVGNYIRPVSIRVVDRAPVVRLIEADVPPARRELIEASPASRGGARHEAGARMLAEAIASGDEAAFTKAADPVLAHRLGKLDGKAPEGSLRRNMGETHKAFLAAERRSPFRTMTALATRQERLFVERGELAAAEPDRAFTCWCRDRDCTGRWPVMVLDADADPRRPYSCIETSQFGLDANDRDTVIATAAPPSAGFAEPDWSKRGN